MRFLNLKISSPVINDLKLEFQEGLNIISISDKEIFSLFKQIPFAGLYGKAHGMHTILLKDFACTINAVSETSGNAVSFNYNEGDFILNDSGITSENSAREEDISEYQIKPRNLYSPSDFIASSFFYPGQTHKNNDPALDREKLKSLLISNEICRLNSPFLRNREILLHKTDKELTDLNRERQLLELKKMKKEKILKEIYLTERNVKKLEKRRDAILTYKTILNEIIAKDEYVNKLSSKIHNLKKDLTELAEIKEKISSVEKILQNKFSHFSEKENDQIPDLEQIQKSFNAFRDINEQMDQFFLNKKFYSGWALKIILSMIIFSATAFLFFLFTSSASFILGVTSGLAASGSGVTALIYYFKIRQLHPFELCDQKKKIEYELIDLLKKNHFSVDDCKTGELYEILFQYFEDFLNYNSVSSELTELKKKISNSSNLIEKEKKLQQFTDDLEKTENLINEAIDNLDNSIHARPERDNISRTIHDINELLEENAVELNEKKILITKFEEEIEEYDKIENSSLSAELLLEEILNRIEGCKERIEHIKYLNTVFDEASEIWSIEKLTELSHVTLEIFLKLTDNSFIKDDIAETINNLLLNSTAIKSEHAGLTKYLSFSIKAALSGILFSGDLPPVFMIDPFTRDNEFADNMKKLLPELFPERQVVVIIPGDDPELIGNMITL